MTLDHLQRAVDGLERALLRAVQAPPAVDAEDLASLRADRDRLAEEVERLRVAAQRDAELRTEATQAVKAALEDLRALMPEGAKHG